MKKFKTELEEILQMKDSDAKLTRLSDFMLKVEYLSDYWQKAREESKRLLLNGFFFEQK